MPRRPPCPATAAGADVLRHDAQLTAAERQLADSHGHATVDDAHVFAARCGVRRLVPTHRAPGRTGGELDDLARTVEPERCVAARAPDVTVAIQGTVVDLR